MANASINYGTNDKTYAAVAPIFRDAEASHVKLFERLLAAGVDTPAVARPLVVRYVAEVHGYTPHESRKGGAWTFVKDSKGHNRVRYLLDLLFPCNPDVETVSAKTAPVKVPKALITELRAMLEGYDAKQIRAALGVIEAADRAAKAAAKAAEKVAA